ncbi:MAG TPA: hypothetical protein VF590_06300 [Isosphaeraceae bacterium]
MNDKHAMSYATNPDTSLWRAPALGGSARSPVPDLGREFRIPKWRSPAPAEEMLIEDDRSKLTPAQAVERKLMSRLQGSSLPVSHLQMRGLVRSRRAD